MKNNFLNLPLVNINKKPSVNSEVASQILYGEKFKILYKKKGWIKIKTNFDNYIGFIKKNKFIKKFKPTHKIYKLKTKIFKKVGKNFLPTNNFLFFASGISLSNKTGLCGSENFSAKSSFHILLFTFSALLDPIS